MAVIPKDSHDWLILFRQQVNEMLTFLTSAERESLQGENEVIPRLDMFETGESFVVEIELPGFDSGDLSLSICSNRLLIEGVKREEKGGQNATYICLERRFGRFSRMVEIPPGADLNGIEARYRKGVLRVSFPVMKNKGAVIRKIPVE